MITIQNVSKRPRKAGRHTYEVCVTVEVDGGKWARKPLCRFIHNREDGMAVCLEKAARAIRLAEGEKLMLLFGGMENNERKVTNG